MKQINDSNELRKIEYDNLYKEILTNYIKVDTVLNICALGTTTLIGYFLTRGITIWSPFLFLVPFAVILPSIMYVTSSQNSTARIASYIITFYEKESTDISWQSSVQKFRESQEKSLFKQSLKSIFTLFGLVCILLSIIFWVYELEPLLNVWKEYDLHLMSVNKTNDLVNEGRNLVIVALVGTKLHIRIFDTNGEKVVDKAENQLMSGKTLATLKKQLNPLPDESDLSSERTQEIIRNATLIASYTSWEQLRLSIINPFYIVSSFYLVLLITLTYFWLRLISLLNKTISPERFNSYRDRWEDIKSKSRSQINIE